MSGKEIQKRNSCKTASRKSNYQIQNKVMETIKNKIINWTIANEVGYSNHPADKGGETKYGITKAVWEQWSSGTIPVSKITIKQAISIYDELYYQPQRIDDIVNDYPILACKFFDASVNLGRFGATTLLQKTINEYTHMKVKVDGYIGKETLRAIKYKQLTDKDFCGLFIQELRAYYWEIVERKPSQEVFIKGWLNRAEKLPKWGDEQ